MVFAYWNNLLVKVGYLLSMIDVIGAKVIGGLTGIFRWSGTLVVLSKRNSGEFRRENF